MSPQDGGRKTMSQRTDVSNTTIALNTAYFALGSWMIDHKVWFRNPGMGFGWYIR
jgi:hypothetical protein